MEAACWHIFRPQTTTIVSLGLMRYSSQLQIIVTLMILNAPCYFSVMVMEVEGHAKNIFNICRGYEGPEACHQ